VSPPALPVWSNATAAPYPGTPDEIRAMLAEHVAGSVRFADEVREMYEAGVRVFVEAGPGRVLTQLVGRILGDRPHRAIATDVPGEHGVQRFLLAVAELAVAGFDVSADALFAERAIELDRAALPARAPGWTIDGHLLRTSAGDVVPGSLRPADEFPVLAPAGGAPADAEREVTVREYLRGLRDVVASQREVMLRFLGEGVPGDVASELAMPSSSGASVGEAPPLEIVAGPSAGGDQAGDECPVTAAPGTPIRGGDLVAAVIGVVQDRTGYPSDMLDLDLDLEADLSIDSIKRVEIVGELAERIGLAAGAGGGIGDDALEALAQLKTLRALVAWIEDSDAADAEPGGAASAAELELEPPARAIRHVVSPATLGPPTAEHGRLDDATIVIADDARGAARALAAALEDLGASVTLLDAAGAPAPADAAALDAADGLIWLRGLHPDAGANPSSFDARSAFAWWRPAVLGASKRLLVATPGGGSFATGPYAAAPGLGLAGMAKAVSRERSGVGVRIVDLDPSVDPEALAELLLDEYLDADRAPVEVGYDGAQRVTRMAAPEPILSAPANGAPPARDRVVLVTGGARGITARAAIAIARQGARAVELAGRSPLPAAVEDPALAGAVDAASLRRALAAAGGLATPAAVEAECARILSAREIRATLATLSELGCEVRYHQLDVRDAHALAALTQDIDERFGRLDLVVHGAGVLDDRLIRDKSTDGFERVFATKVDAARTLLDIVAPDTDIVFFGSVSGVFGNRGQVDYAAANDALDELALAASRVRPGRIVSVDWGPWAGAGMVSPELEREYARRGVGLIDPEDGVRSLLDELALPHGPAQVVIMRARPDEIAPEPQTLPALEAVSR
jgi:NAD(P)-dependent dehydrogenase (short-subunit alcohol dehydrogenase family)